MIKWTKKSAWAVGLIVAIQVVLMSIVGIGISQGISFTGAPEIVCNPIGRTISCDDAAAVGARFEVLVSGSSPDAEITSEPMVWAARAAGGALILGFGTWIVLGLIQAIGARKLYRRISRTPPPQRPQQTFPRRK